MSHHVWERKMGPDHHTQEPSVSQSIITLWASPLGQMPPVGLTHVPYQTTLNEASHGIATVSELEAGDILNLSAEQVVALTFLAHR